MPGKMLTLSPGETMSTLARQAASMEMRAWITGRDCVAVNGPVIASTSDAIILRQGTDVAPRIAVVPFANIVCMEFE